MKFFFTLILATVFIILNSPSTISAVNTKVSLKKGVGLSISDICMGRVDRDSCNARLRDKLSQLGITWYYNWWDYKKHRMYDNGKFDYAPMFYPRGSPNPPYFTEEELSHFTEYASENLGSYWLVWNEPDLWPGLPGGVPDIVAPFKTGPDDSTQPDWRDTAVLTGRNYNRIYTAIKKVDPQAKFIIGGVSGVNYYDYDRRWPQVFINEYKRLNNNNYPPFDGWHVHYYRCQGNYSVDTWRRDIVKIRDWINRGSVQYTDSDGQVYWGGGGSTKELWITEWGCLYEWDNISNLIIGNGGSDSNLDWLENYEGVQRYAWFVAGSPETETRHNWPDPLYLFSGRPWESNFNLSSTGNIYASYPTVPNPAKYIDFAYGWNRISWKSSYPDNVKMSELNDGCRGISFGENFNKVFLDYYMNPSNYIFSDNNIFRVNCRDEKRWFFR